MQNVPPVTINNTSEYSLLATCSVVSALSSWSLSANELWNSFTTVSGTTTPAEFGGFSSFL